MESQGQSEDNEQAVEVWICDEHPIFRRGLIASLHGSEFRLAGESADLRSEEIAEVDVLVFAATKVALEVLGQFGSEPRRVAIADRRDHGSMLEAVDRGASAVLDRAQMTPDTLVNAIRTVDAGATLLPEGVLSELISGAVNGRGQASGGLTQRELAVLRMLAEGDDTREIAGTLAYSERTVKNVVHDLLMKMNCRNRAHAVARATRQGVI